jgi:hypothetical protein
MNSYDIEAKYWDWIMDHHPENYGHEDNMIKNWEGGFLFDDFAEYLGMTEDQLLEAVS